MHQHRKQIKNSTIPRIRMSITEDLRSDMPVNLSGTFFRTMGGARNLKVGATWEHGPGHRGALKFCVCAKCRRYLVFVCIDKKRNGPPEAQALLAFGHLMKAANLPVF